MVQAHTPVRVTNRTAPQAIHNRVDFDGSNITGRSGEYIGVGRLPAEYQDALYVAPAHDDFYVVKSYETPVAWFANGAWNMPDVRYSATTTRHQNLVRKAIEDARLLEH